VSPDLALVFVSEGEELHLRGARASRPEHQHRGRVLHRTGECLCGLAVAEGVAVYSADIRTDARCSWQECRQAGLVSFAALPLRSAERVFGVLGIASATRRDFSERAAFLETLADTVAAHLSNALLYEDVQRQADELADANRRLTAEIAERARAEEALRRSEDRASLAQRIAGIGTWEWDVQADKVYWSEEIAGIFGSQLAEASQHYADVLAAVHPEDRERMQESVRACLEDGQEHVIEYRVVRADESVRWVSVLGDAQRDSAGRPLRMLGVVLDVTERKQAETALRENERFLSTLLSNLPGMVYRSRNDPSWTMDFVSDGSSRLLGYPPGDLLNNCRITYGDLIHPEDQSQVWEGIQAALRDRTSYLLTYRVTTAGGEERWCWERGRGVFSETGELLFLEGFITDITERIRAEEGLRASEERLRTFLDNVDDMVYFQSLDGHLAHLNTVSEQISGHALGELVDHPAAWNELIVPEDRQAIERFLAEQAGTVDRFEVDYRLRTRSGERRWIQSRKVAARDAQGRIIGYNCIDRDITDRRQAQDALQDRHVELEQVFAAIPDAVIYADRDRRITRVNNAFTGIFGYQPDEVLGELTRILYASEEEFRQQGRLRYNVHADPPDRHEVYEVAYCRKDGEVFAGETVGTPVRDARGEVIGLLGIVRDVTERKQAQEALRRSEATLASIFRAAPIGIGLTVDRVIQKANEQLCRMVGRSSAALAGQSTRALYASDEEFERFGEVMDTQTGERGTWTVETRWLRKDGAVIDVLLSSTPLKPGDLSAGVTFTALDITERKRAELALRESEARFAAFMDHFPSIAFIKDADGRAVYLNRYFDEAFGARESWLNRTPEEIFPPDLAGHIAADDARALREGYVTSEETLTDRSGTPRLFQTHKFAIRRAGATPLVGGFALDITARRRAEEALGKSQRRYETLFEWANDGILTMQGDRFTACNRRALEIIGRPEEQVVGRAPGDISPETQPDGRRSEEKAVDILQAVYAGTPRVFEWRHIRGDGTEVDVEVSLNRVDIEDEPALLCLWRDITERKQAQRELEATWNLLRAAIEQTPAGVIVAEAPDARIRLANAAALGIRGGAQNSLTGIPMSEHREAWRVLDPDGDPVRAEELPLSRAILRGETTRDQELLIERDNGERRWVSASAAPVRGATGGIIAGVVVFPDITERKRAAEELARYREHLEELVRERTAEVEAAHRELVRKERLAVLGQLTATVSHELRNPLGTIRTSMYSIDERVRGRGLGVERALDRAERNIQRCDAIIEELLDYTRATRLRRVMTGLDEWLTGVLAEQSFPEGIGLTLNLRSAARVAIDHDRLQRCLNNVVGNACQAMAESEPPGGELVVGSAADGHRVVVTVCDNGPGMPAETLRRVFEPLFSTRSFGVGLGLPIVKQIMEQHGGGVEIESQEGEGTAVRLWLPLSEPPEA